MSFERVKLVGGSGRRIRLLLLLCTLSLVLAGTVAMFALAGSSVVRPSITAHPAARTASSVARFAFLVRSGDPDRDGDREAAGLQCSLDGAVFARCGGAVRYRGLRAGAHRFRVRASIESRLSAPTTFAWVIDRQAPSVSLRFPAPGGRYSEAGWIGGCGVCGRASDRSGVRSVSVSLRQGLGRWWNGHAFASNREVFLGARGASSWRLPVGAALLAGGYTVRVRATDRLGNTALRSTSSFSILVPLAPVITGHPPASTTATGATFTFTESQRGVRFACRLDSRAPGPCSSPAGYPGLAAGSYVFYVAAVDQAGNASPVASYRWTITAGQTQGMPFSMAGDAAGVLLPGSAPAQVPLSLSNPNPVAIQVTSIIASVDPSSLPAGCQAAWFQITQSDASASSPVTVPAHGSLTVPAQGVSAPAIRLVESGTNQDACQHAHLTLTYAGSAHS